MSTGRRLAKRSILGTRVSAPGQDGRYHSAIIQATKTSEGTDGGGDNVYSVVFDESRAMKELKESEIIGPGFQSVSSIKLKPGQKVFVTYNGREVWGAVICHWPHIDEVQIRVNLPNETLELKKKLEEVRLLESRKSARLHDQDQDYSRLADIGPLEPTRKRPTSHVIDVPTAQR